MQHASIWMGLVSYLCFVGTLGYQIHVEELSGKAAGDVNAAMSLEVHQKAPKLPQSIWSVRSQILQHRLDGYPAVLAAPVSRHSAAFSFSVSPPRNSGDESGVQNWGKLVRGRSLTINYGETGPPFPNYADVQQFMPTLLRSTCLKYAISEVDRSRARGGRNNDVKTEYHVAKTLKAGVEAIVHVERALVCLQAKVVSEPRTSSAVRTEQFHTIVKMGIYGWVDLVDRRVAQKDWTRLAHGDANSGIIATFGKRQFLGLEVMGGKEPRLDNINELGEDPSAQFSDPMPGLRRHRNKLADLQGRPLPGQRTLDDSDDLDDFERHRFNVDMDKVFKIALDQAPDFVCPQEEVLRLPGYSDFCVHLGIRAPSGSPNEELSVSAAERFALQCAAMYPTGTVLIAKHHQQLWDKKSSNEKSLRVRSRWVLRECGQGGWMAPVVLDDTAGSAAYEVCEDSRDDNYVGAREMLKAAGLLKGKLKFKPIGA